MCCRVLSRLALPLGGGGTCQKALAFGGWWGGRCILAVAGQHEFGPTDKGAGKVGLLRRIVIAQGYMSAWTEELPRVPLGGAASGQGSGRGYTACRVSWLGLWIVGWLLTRAGC